MLLCGEIIILSGEKQGFFCFFCKNRTITVDAAGIIKDNALNDTVLALRHIAYYHGGPYFNLKSGDDAEIVARYDIIGQPSAIVKKNYGKGCVILSGVHFEDKGEDLLKAVHKLQLDVAETRQIAEKLVAGEVSRQLLFDKMMTFCQR